MKKNYTPDEVIVPQDNPNFRIPVINLGVWWQNLDRSHGWRLQKNKVTGYCRILSPENKRMAWGRQWKMTNSFNKVKNQIGTDSVTTKDWWTLVIVKQDYINATTAVMNIRVWWKVIDEDNGWTLQQHIITGHCRIIDPVSVRRAWGGEKEMKKSFDDVKEQIKKLLNK